MISPSHLELPDMELLEELGRGSHSVVYAARRGERTFALKVPLFEPGQPSSPRLTERWLREGVALARVRHPALPEVLEVGRDGRCPYLIMELAVGETLAERLQRGVLSPTETELLGRELASALVQIHGAGLIHQDIKPRNIVFDAATSGVRLIDFGFAARLDDQSRPPLASPAYAAPEQIRGLRQRVDARADLYALGCVLLECLVGPGWLDVRASLQHAPLAPALPPALDRVPARLRAILARLLARDPDQRFASALEVLHSLLGTRPGEDAGIGRARRCVGRAYELGSMRLAWSEARVGGAFAAVVRGAPGGGKTALVRAFTDEIVDADHRVLRARCDSSELEPLSAVRQLLGSWVDALKRGPAEQLDEASEKLAQLAGDTGPLLALIVPALGELLPEQGLRKAPNLGEQMVVETLAELLRRLITELAPVVLVVEDVHWIDASSRRVLSLVVERARDARVLYVFSERAAVAPSGADRLLKDHQPDRTLQLELGLLADAEIEALVHAYLGSRRTDPELQRHCLALSDRTPLGVLEVLRTMLDGGALRPHWGEWVLDGARLAAMALPVSALEILTRRVGALEASTRALLIRAAVLGTSCEDEVLAEMCGVEEAEFELALAEARHARLLEDEPQRRHRFVLHTFREALLAQLSPEATSQLHEDAARALERVLQARFGDAPDWLEHVDRQFPPVTDLIASEIEGSVPFVLPLGAGPIEQLASHYTRASRGEGHERAFWANLVAGKIAFVSFDNRRALSFLSNARALEPALGRSGHPELEFLIAEAQARTGALAESVASFERALARSDDPFTQARSLSRIAWIQMQLDTSAAWAALESAFEKLGEPAPSRSAASIVQSSLAFGGRLLPIRPLTRFARPRDPKRTETLCLLHYQAARLAVQTNQPGRLLQAAARALPLAEQIGQSCTLARTYLLYSFMLTVLGFGKAGRAYLDRAEEISRALRDPVAIAHVLEVRGAIAAWSGDLDGCIRFGASALKDYGQWLELGEYCIIVLNHYQIEALRGRASECWRWVEDAVHKIQAQEQVTVIPAVIEHAAVAALTTLGRHAEADALLGFFRSLAATAGQGGGFELTSYGPRVRALVDRGELGEPFQRLVAEFEGLELDPARVHLGAVEYYVAVAHARVQACLGASPESRPARVAELGRALGDLQRAARIPLVEAHAHAIAGYHAWWSSDPTAAEQHFARAESLGCRENAPWVLYAVHRGRAHRLWAQGALEAAAEQAALAEALALRHGAVYRAEWVRREFELTRRRASELPRLADAVLDTSSDGSRVRRYFHALLRISNARTQTTELRALASRVVDEVLEACLAERALLLVRDPDALERPDARQSLDDMVVVAARKAGAEDAELGPGYDRTLVAQVCAERAADVGYERRLGDARHEPATTLAAPLLVRSEVLGCVYLERPLRLGPFSDEDVAGISALALQLPIVLELTRSVTARERAEQNLRNVQKMEAIARLSGGIAHDFNNMLSAIRTSLELLEDELQGRPAHDDLRTIRSAAARAEELTRQLLVFSRGQFLEPKAFQLNERIERILPLLQDLLPHDIDLELRLERRLPPVLADPGQLDQVITNLVVNARDAMPDGGKVQIETASVLLDESYSARHPHVKPGRYAQLSVTDSGSGMDAATLSRIFEPFFTTKADRGGTGLGLAVVYGVVTQSEGHVDVFSRPGAGASFSVYLPVAAQNAGLHAPPSGADEGPASSGEREVPSVPGTR